MRTDDLIRTLAADTAPGPDIVARLCAALGVAVLLAAGAVWALWGVRPDLGAALSGATLGKTLGPAVLAAPALVLALRRARPAQGAGGLDLALGALVAAAGIGLATALALQGGAALPAALAAGSLVLCLTSIPMLAALPLAAALWALRAGAPLAPARAGALAGLGAGGLGAAVYSFACTDDAVLFVLPAYGAAIGLVTLLGAVLGTRLLRW